MKLRSFLCLLLAILMLVLVGCDSKADTGDGGDTTPTSNSDNNTPSNEQSDSSESEEESSESSKKNTEASKKTEDTKVEKTYNILFIGNSYTYYSDMPTAIFEKIAKFKGYDVNVTTITYGGYTLAKFADPADEYGAKVETALTGTVKYDYVILQEQSSRPAGSSVADFYDAVRNLAQRIRATGATPILYSTWGRKTGSSTLTNNGWTNESMTWKLAAAYQAIGDELDIPVAHVGLAFYDVYTGDSNIELYNEDMSHPSYAGSYLAAATLYAKIFDVDPIKSNYSGSLTSANAVMLRATAKKAVFNTPEIPDEYKTSSVGVTNN